MTQLPNGWSGTFVQYYELSKTFGVSRDDGCKVYCVLPIIIVASQASTVSLFNAIHANTIIMHPQPEHVGIHAVSRRGVLPNIFAITSKGDYSSLGISVILSDGDYR